VSIFITFEGAEGSGKSYQASQLHKRLSALGIQVVLTREPGGTAPGEMIARLLKWAQDAEISPLTELFLFNASRAQHMKDIIQPALESGKVVICDRFADSTTSYQGYGHGLDLEMVKYINYTTTGGLRPDLTVLLDITPEEGFGRKKGRKRDRFEREDIDFHRRVREGYLKLAAEEPQRWLVVDASQSRTKIKEVIWQRVNRLLSVQ